MSKRMPARHRAPQKAITPFTGIGLGLSQAFSGRVGTLGKAGAVAAVSSGLVATMGLPANAATTASGPITSPTSFGRDVVSAHRTVTTTGAHRTKVKRLQLKRDTPARSVRKPLAHLDIARQRERSNAKRAVVREVSEVGSNYAKSPRVRAANLKAAKRGAAAMVLAQRYLGVKYRYGGSRPTGFDCSGFTSYVYRALGIQLPRTAMQQLRKVKQVPRSKAQIGDLVFFNTGGYISHVGIYAGKNSDGKPIMYDASRSKRRIVKREVYSATAIYGRIAV